MCYGTDADGDAEAQTERLADWLEAKLNSIINYFRGSAPQEGVESVVGGNEDVDRDTKTTDLGDSGIETKDESVSGDVTDDTPQPVGGLCEIC